MTTSTDHNRIFFVGDILDRMTVRQFTKLFAEDHDYLKEFAALYYSESIENVNSHIRTLDQVLRSHIRAEAYFFMDKCRVRVYGEDAIKFKLVYGEYFNHD